jgi:peptidylprolyl isomerase
MASKLLSGDSKAMIKEVLVGLTLLLVMMAIVISGCGGKVVEEGDLISVHYTGKLVNGELFDSSVGREPLQFTVGQGQVIAGFEKAVLGMKVGDSVIVTIPMEEAYGPVIEELLFEVDRTEIPSGLEPKVGQRIVMSRADGSQAVVSVVAVWESSLLLDANHVLAGKDLIFDIQLIEIH